MGKNFCKIIFYLSINYLRNYYLGCNNNGRLLIPVVDINSINRCKETKGTSSISSR